MAGGMEQGVAMRKEAEEPQGFFIKYPFDEVIGLYDDPITRWYCKIRSHILRNRILAEIGQYLPMRGSIAELGCGFGLYSLCFSITHPDCDFDCCDLSRRRIDQARAVAGRLDLSNVQFACRDAVEFVKELEPKDCIYLFDLVHHLPAQAMAPFLAEAWRKVKPGGLLIVKDLHTSPRYKMAFSWILDYLMTRGEHPNYRPIEWFYNIFAPLGGQVRVHFLDDYLPYPHVLYLVQKPLD